MSTPNSLNRDANYVAVGGGVLDDGSGTIKPILIDSVTGRLKVSATISGGLVSQIIAGTNITISPSGGTGAVTINSSGGGGSSYQSPLSGGLTGTNTWTTAPNVIVIDNVPRQKVQTDGTIMWTGTTTTVLTNAPLPTFDIFASA